MIDRDQFYEKRNSRTLIYTNGRILDPSRWIALTADDEYMRQPEGQVAAIVITNLLARMTPRVRIAFPDVDTHPRLSVGREKSLHKQLVTDMRAADPFGEFEISSGLGDAYQLHLGINGEGRIVHGQDWNAYVGEGPSPLIQKTSTNVFGAAFSAILAVAKITEPPFPTKITATAVDTLRWQNNVGENCLISSEASLGDAWIIGAGSVGSAIAYFLELTGLRGAFRMIDKDIVKLENLDRSPVFTFDDANGKIDKAKAVALYLRKFGLSADYESAWYHEAETWKTRQQNTPDLFFSAANERNVRYVIESSFPPIQIYGTTGRNWQASMLRHIPSNDPCSCCIFPPAASAQIACATSSATLTNQSTGVDELIDAALPFLSFAAGFMAVAEAAKLLLEDFPFSPHRVSFTPCSESAVNGLPMSRRHDCICQNRSNSVHQKMVGKSKFSTQYAFSQ